MSECIQVMENFDIRTNVDEVALAVQHDVSIVPVFNLQQEEHQAVSCHAADEVVACLEMRKNRWNVRG